MTSKEKQKKYLILIAALLVCAVFVVLIGNRMSPDQEPDAPAAIVAEESEGQEVVIPGNKTPSGNPEVSASVPDNAKPSLSSEEGAAVSSGTEQTIQSDISKPEPPEPPEPQGETRDTETPPAYNPKDTSKPPQSSSAPPAGGKPGEVYVPGFGWVPQSDGETSMGSADSDGDINKQVGNM